ncbi:MAG TPA: SDR family NAD(P)-dependent oxidoreductase, partial [Bradyrhizobium sp.]
SSFILSYNAAMARKLDGMVVIITGASAGIGAALARELSGAGARLALAARRADRLEELNRELGGQHLCVATDVADPRGCLALIGAAHERFGRIDTLVCNAGYGIHRRVIETDAAALTEIFRTNVLGTTECLIAAGPIMLRQELRDGWRGQVMIVSSVVARRSIPFFGAYSATKAAQLSLAEAMRVEAAPDRIAVTTVHPVGTETEFGDVSAGRSAGNRPQRIAGEVQQSAQTVARAMVKGIRSPCPEVWPFRPARWGVGIATLLPGLVDRVLARRRDQIAGQPPTN